MPAPASEPAICRICLHRGEDPLFKVCVCNDPVHKACLDHWRLSSNNWCFCPNCKEHYKATFRIPSLKERIGRVTHHLLQQAPPWHAFLLLAIIPIFLVVWSRIMINLLLDHGIVGIISYGFIATFTHVALFFTVINVLTGTPWAIGTPLGCLFIVGTAVFMGCCIIKEAVVNIIHEIRNMREAVDAFEEVT